MLASTLGLVALAPVLVLLALAVRLEGSGSILFRQERVGRDGGSFNILKFRTMVPDADRLGPGFTRDGDPRITRIGRWMRRYKLDELPQLYNVLVGDMSLVGPRPELPVYVALYTHAERRILRYRPGITDPTSIEFRDEERLLRDASDPERFYREELIPQKARLNLAYAERATVFTDLLVIARTVAVLARSAG